MDDGEFYAGFSALYTHRMSAAAVNSQGCLQCFTRPSAGIIAPRPLQAPVRACNTSANEPGLLSTFNPTAPDLKLPG
jgi:hypothetical protein